MTGLPDQFLIPTPVTQKGSYGVTCIFPGHESKD